ncbi:MAG: GNAT family N-acetyltransferase [Acetivibrio ethanolgignens]
MIVKGVYLNGENDLGDAFEIRRKVFIEEQGVPEELELDEMDAYAIHALVYVEGKAVATGRIIYDGYTYKIGRVAVLKEERGKQYGDFIMRMLIDKAFLHGAEEVILGAQLTAVGFYEKLGFEKYGEVFDDAGIPHIHMKLKRENLCKKCSCGEK